MKKLTFLAALGAIIFCQTALATESIGEKAQVKANDLKRVATEKVHRIEEAACMKSDAKCLALKAKNRVKEAGVVVKDKAVELKNAMTD